ncbi:hypothetical protein NYQ43_09020 [Xanthomonas translucens pv. translucens]|uniref:hypothetical protein n=1 Tax=Xanthomonas campestris pv. translucens TaxID=343 RepID=UPI0021B78B6C|nr:hypothetical protein [Xanthomonas translucens]MCT8285835.1 hypothetical protein [Xanthomonas translucens pv. translucens]MCT8303493.1 hypothetical protein [Xanthomonas translucens pv. translucens]
MNAKHKSDKGAVLEEVLRNYFLKSGFYVVRGVPFRLAEDDATDVDLWLYERPTGSSRRVQICDIKYKQRPKAVERILWTSGLARALTVDGAYVATTDKRQALQPLARRLDLHLIDGNDIQRIQDSQSLSDVVRISDEQLLEKIRVVEVSAMTRRLQDARSDILSALAEGFGDKSSVRSLEAFSNLADLAVKSRPDSEQARLAVRLAYLAASVLCVSLDYVSVQSALKPIEERRAMVMNAIRMGALASEEGKNSLHLALALIGKYSPGGHAAAQALERALKSDLDQIPAEVIADQATRLIKSDQLFAVAKEFEAACYSPNFIDFDAFNVSSKSMLGALLDYSDVDRSVFARIRYGSDNFSNNGDVGLASKSSLASKKQPELFVKGEEAVRPADPGHTAKPEK